MKHARLASLILTILIAISLTVQPSANAQALPTTVYNAVPVTLPYNMASLGFQATQTAEFGDYIHLAGTDRYLQSVTVTMSDWAKNSEYPLMPAAGFDHPITVNIYSVVPGSPLNTVGTLLGSVTETKTIPWRPEADPTCPGGTAWRAADNQCYNGLAFNLTFDMSSLALTLPDDIIVGIAYNTQTWGYAPLGVAGPYNSLNVGVVGTLTVGTDDNTDNVFWNTSTAAWYSDGGAGGVGIFREDTVWSPYGTIPVQIVAGPPPAPAVGLSTTSINFGNQLMGTTSPAQTVTLTNTGDADLHIGLLSFTSDWILSNDTCSNATVIPAGTCTFDVAFHPLALGPLTGSITIPSDAASSPDIVSLSGNGVGIPVGTNLLKKPDFASASVFPNPWQLFGVKLPYASALDCTVYQIAPCSVYFPAGNRSAMQRVLRPGLAGDMYHFGLSSMSQNAGGVYRVEVTFYNNYNRPVGTASLNFTPGTHAWETISGYATATGNYNRIVYRFFYQNSIGRAWFDDAFLMVAP